jgi:hypothetical protein
MIKIERIDFTHTCHSTFVSRKDRKKNYTNCYFFQKTQEGSKGRRHERERHEDMKARRDECRAKIFPPLTEGTKAQNSAWDDIY